MIFNIELKLTIQSNCLGWIKLINIVTSFSLKSFNKGWILFSCLDQLWSCFFKIKLDLKIAKRAKENDWKLRCSPRSARGYNPEHQIWKLEF